MSIPRRSETGDRPSHELRHFTDREDALAVFHGHLHRPPGVAPPVLMFYGVGGRGKSWLLRKLRADLAGDGVMPSAFIDLDPALNGARFHNDLAALLVEIWRQLDAECPRFETAYAWMKFKQGGGDEPLVRHSGKVSAGWELVKEGPAPGWAGSRASTWSSGPPTSWGRPLSRRSRRPPWVSAFSRPPARTTTLPWAA
jgi:hypothetical protein